MKKFNPLVLSLIAALPLSSMAASSSSSKIPDWKLAEASEVWTPVPAVVTANENTPPSDAIVLFDGKSIDKWQGGEGGEAKWTVKNGVLTVAPKTGDIKTKESFCDIQLHLEWATPTKVTDDEGKELTSQGRNNSGVFLQEQYEVQILDSYNNKTYSNGQAGSIYKQHIPLVNPTRAPGVWQNYDIIFTAPKFSDDKKLASPGRVTVLLNGVLVQNNVEILGKTEWIIKPQYYAHGCMPIRLQDHGNPMNFRNIWVRKL
ncbi:MAG: DUF1080 domain-containing protein [Chitinophagaceae bacterium]|nr:MAG: DUF1080 domain-containing protein [Chitinophagaceae bacterium]